MYFSVGCLCVLICTFQIVCKIECGWQVACRTVVEDYSTAHLQCTNTPPYDQESLLSSDRRVLRHGSPPPPGMETGCSGTTLHIDTVCIVRSSMYRPRSTNDVRFYCILCTSMLNLRDFSVHTRCTDEPVYYFHFNNMRWSCRVCDKHCNHDCRIFLVMLRLDPNNSHGMDSVRTHSRLARPSIVSAVPLVIIASVKCIISFSIPDTVTRSYSVISRTSCMLLLGDADRYGKVIPHTSIHMSLYVHIFQTSCTEYGDDPGAGMRTAEAASEPSTGPTYESYYTMEGDANPYKVLRGGHRTGLSLCACGHGIVLLWASRTYVCNMWYGMCGLTVLYDDQSCPRECNASTRTHGCLILFFQNVCMPNFLNAYDVWFDPVVIHLASDKQYLCKWNIPPTECILLMRAGNVEFRSKYMKSIYCGPLASRGLPYIDVIACLSHVTNTMHEPLRVKVDPFFSNLDSEIHCPAIWPSQNRIENLFLSPAAITKSYECIFTIGSLDQSSNTSRYGLAHSSAYVGLSVYQPPTVGLVYHIGCLIYELVLIIFPYFLQSAVQNGIRRTTSMTIPRSYATTKDVNPYPYRCPPNVLRRIALTDVHQSSIPLLHLYSATQSSEESTFSAEPGAHGIGVYFKVGCVRTLQTSRDMDERIACIYYVTPVCNSLTHVKWAVSNVGSHTCSILSDINTLYLRSEVYKTLLYVVLRQRGYIPRCVYRLYVYRISVSGACAAFPRTFLRIICVNFYMVSVFRTSVSGACAASPITHLGIRFVYVYPIMRLLVTLSLERLDSFVSGSYAACFNTYLLPKKWKLHVWILLE